MSDAADIPESDRLDGAPHPRMTRVLVGQDEAQARFLEAFNSGRLHHGWLITGARGIGKATLAWRIARFLLARRAGDGPAPPAETADTLDIPPDHPVSRRVDALSEPRLFVLRRSWDAEKNAMKTVITVREARQLKRFFALSAPDGGRRVVIVDCAEDLHPGAANALLKLLEEPPEDATLLLVSHQPSGLLPTIRSRCQELRCRPLSGDDMVRAMSAARPDDDPGSDASAAALSELSGGSVGEALRISTQDGMRVYGEIVDLFSTLPRLHRPEALKLAESVAGRGKSAQARFELVLHLLDLFLARTARTGISGPPIVEAAPGEAMLMKRLCPAPPAGRAWAALQQDLGARARKGRAVNLDPAALILDMIFRIADLAERLPER